MTGASVRRLREVFCRNGDRKRGLSPDHFQGILQGFTRQIGMLARILNKGSYVVHAYAFCKFNPPLVVFAVPLVMFDEVPQDKRQPLFIFHYSSPFRSLFTMDGG
jgi:hypothetical protein